MKILYLGLPPAMQVNEMIAKAIYKADWIALSESMLFLREMKKEQSIYDVVHWMIQTKEIPTIQVLHVLDTMLLAENHPIADLIPTTTTLLQRAVYANRIDVMTALIERGHPLCHDLDGSVERHPLLSAMHPTVTPATFEALVSYYTFPSGNAFVHYTIQQRPAFFIGMRVDHMKALVESGADRFASRFDFLAADEDAMMYAVPESLSQELLIEYLFHYLEMRIPSICLFVAQQFQLPFVLPSLAAAVLRSNYKEVVAACISILHLDEAIVAEGKSAMLIAAECNADESCAALMGNGVSGTFEEGGSWLSIGKKRTAYTAALERNAGLAKELLQYNQDKK